MAHIPVSLNPCETIVFHEAGVVIVIKGLQWLGHRHVGQEHSGAAKAVVPLMPLAHHDRLDRIGLEVVAVVVTPLMVKPPQILLIHTALIKAHLGQEGGTRGVMRSGEKAV
jgi:hypothetical protein